MTPKINLLNLNSHQLQTESKSNPPEVEYNQIANIFTQLDQELQAALNELKPTPQPREKTIIELSTYPHLKSKTYLN